MEINVDLKELLETVFLQIDAMKKVILTWAFCGELGTNDPEEEGAGINVENCSG